MRNLLLGKRVLVTRRRVDNAAFIRVERVKANYWEDEDLVLKLRLGLVSSEVDSALGTETLDVDVILCLDTVWWIGKRCL